MSPAPTDPQSNNFSNRLRTHSRVVEHWQPRDDRQACVWAVNDQLLVSASVSPQVDTWLAGQGIEAKHLTTLFTDLPSVDARLDDLEVIQVKLPKKRDIFSITTELRDQPFLEGKKNKVSPNHVLVPAPAGDGCPHGPPSEYSGTIPPQLPVNAEPRRGMSPAITLIDSGYQWQQQWGQNPLTAVLGHKQSMPNPVSWPDAGGWVPSPADVLQANSGKLKKTKRLDALAGHANFAAGVLAQRCNEPKITIWNQNGGFIGKDLGHLPTEASILRALLESQQKAPTAVILVTFAFCAYESLPAAFWMDMLQQVSQYNDNFVLVAPAGNQGSFLRRYPAALHSAAPPPFAFTAGDMFSDPRVIGVASLDATTANDISDFSNRGTGLDPWVTCAAIGEEVTSTFLHVDLPTEDDPWPLGTAPKGHNFAANNWAVWQGTSFAAPKVAAAIANRLQTQPVALDAWNELAAGRVADAEVGIRFTDI
jgi:hypothetical protein